MKRTHCIERAAYSFSLYWVSNLHLTASIFQLYSSPQRTQLSLQPTATHLPRGHLCVMIVGETLRYKSIFSLCPFSHRPGVYFWSTYQSLTCLILFLHLCLECFTLLPSGADLCLLGRESGEKAEDSCYGLSGIQASSENSAKPGGERGSWSVSLFSRI